MKLISQHSVISILVRDQDEALRFYTEKLRLEMRKDVTFAPGLRLLTVGVRGQAKPEIALEHVGRQVPMVFVTDNCRKEYERLRARGVKFASAPTQQLYGLEAVFEDLYGHAFSLLEASPEALSSFEQHSIGTAA